MSCFIRWPMARITGRHRHGSPEYPHDVELLDPWRLRSDPPPNAGDGGEGGGRGAALSGSPSSH
jgi:hypothetical protein